jgi:hypothetical protein
MTGYNFYITLQEKVNKEYSDYLSPVKANRLMEDGAIRVIEDIYSKLIGMKEYEALSSLLVINHEVTSFPVAVNTLPNNYTVLLGVRPNYLTPVTFTYTDGKFYNDSHNLRVGDTLKLGSSNVTVTEVRPRYFKIDTAYTTGTLSLVLTSTAVSDKVNKKNVFSTPTKYSPKFSVNYNPSTDVRGITISPTPSTAEIDYLTKLPVAFDANDTATDLNTYYPDFFLTKVMDECVKNFAIRTKDTGFYQTSRQEIVDNP